jgi:hypothetical protein
MQHLILYKSDYLVLEYNALANYMHAMWAAEQTPATIREGYEQILHYLTSEHCHRLLDNHLAIQGIWADLADWVSQDWYPRAQRAGLESQAVVFATDYFGRRSTEAVLRQIAGGAIAGFDDVDTARRALLSN